MTARGATACRKAERAGGGRSLRRRRERSTVSSIRDRSLHLAAAPPSGRRTPYVLLHCATTGAHPLTVFRSHAAWAAATTRSHGAQAVEMEREIRHAMAVWVDGSLPPEFFEVSNRHVVYCVQCLKDDKEENLATCSRCGGRLHLECLKHSHGRNRLCHDCVRAPFAVPRTKPCTGPVAE